MAVAPRDETEEWRISTSASTWAGTWRPRTVLGERALQDALAWHTGVAV